VGWYRESPEKSLQLIELSGISHQDHIIDIGCGALPLAAELLTRGYQKLSSLDISEAAIASARQQMGYNADKVSWYVTDIGQFSPPDHYMLWHDRAVFHFLTSESDRKRYIEVLDRQLAPNGRIIIATFAPDGPSQCSGLDIVRYDATTISSELGGRFRLQQTRSESHVTPSGVEQSFNWFLFSRA